MSNISEWNIAAASNNSSPPNGAPEGMPPSGVNDTMRETQAAVARWYGDTDGSLVTTGSGNAYVLTSNSGFTLHADISLLVFRIDRANTGTSTLAVDGLTAKTLRSAGSALISGQLVADTIVAASYNSTDDVYDLHTVPKIDAADLVGEIADARLSSNVPLLDQGNTWTAAAAQTFKRTDTSPMLVIERTASATNAAIQAVTTGGSMHFGAQNGTTFAVGASADLSSSPWLEASASGVNANDSEVLTIDVLAAATNIDVSGLAATDSIPVNDNGVLKQIDVQDMGSRIIASATQTLALSDANAVHVNTTANDHTITVPPNSSVAFPVGAELAFMCQSTGNIIVAAGSGVTISSLGSALTVSASGGGAYLVKTATDTWSLTGNLE